MEDDKIVTLFLARDEQAIAQCAKAYGGRLRALSFGLVCDRQTAEECENDTYLRAWNSIPPHEPRTYLYAFLARIVRRLSLNRCRDEARLKRRAVICQLDAEMEQCLPSADDAACRVGDDVLSELINGFLGSLDEKKRVLFMRRYWYAESLADIAHRFGCSEGYVKTTLFRCREKMRKYFEERGYRI